MATKDPKKKLQWEEFECPECTAHNPYGHGFTFGDEVFCAFCGQVFIVKKGPDGDTYKLVTR